MIFQVLFLNIIHEFLFIYVHMIHNSFDCMYL